MTWQPKNNETKIAEIQDRLLDQIDVGNAFSQPVNQIQGQTGILGQGQAAGGFGIMGGDSATLLLPVKTTKFDVSGVDQTTFDRLDATGTFMIIEDGNPVPTNPVVKTIQRTANSGVRIYLTPKKGTTLTLQTGGNIDITTNLVITDKEVAWMIFIDDEVTPSNSRYILVKGSFGGASSGIAPEITWKKPVRVASTVDVDIPTGLVVGQFVDAVSLNVGDRVLLKNQAVPRDNGIYTAVVAGAGIRASDFDSTALAVSEVAMLVEEGTVNKQKLFHLSTPNAITLGTTSLTFIELTAGAAEFFGPWTANHNAGAKNLTNLQTTAYVDAGAVARASILGDAGVGGLRISLASGGKLTISDVLVSLMEFSTANGIKLFKKLDVNDQEIDNVKSITINDPASAAQVLINASTAGPVFVLTTGKALLIKDNITDILKINASGIDLFKRDIKDIDRLKFVKDSGVVDVTTTPQIYVSSVSDALVLNNKDTSPVVITHSNVIGAQFSISTFRKERVSGLGTIDVVRTGTVPAIGTLIGEFRGVFPRTTGGETLAGIISFIAEDTGNTTFQGGMAFQIEKFSGQEVFMRFNSAKNDKIDILKNLLLNNKDIEDLKNLNFGTSGVVDATKNQIFADSFGLNLNAAAGKNIFFSNNGTKFIEFRNGSIISTDLNPAITIDSNKAATGSGGQDIGSFNFRALSTINPFKLYARISATTVSDVEPNLNGKFTFKVSSNQNNAVTDALEINSTAGVITIDVLSHKVINGLDPTAAQDLATKAYVDATAGGGGSPLTTKGDLFGFSTVAARIPIGSNGQVLTADSAQTLGLKWDTLNAANRNLSNLDAAFGSAIGSMGIFNTSAATVNVGFKSRSDEWVVIAINSGGGNNTVTGEHFN